MPISIGQYAQVLLKGKELIERVAPRYDANPTKLYRVKRTLLANQKLILKCDGDVYGVFVDDDDLLPNATQTINQTGFNPANMKDHDDTTYSPSAADITAGSTVNHATWDFGSIANRIIIYNASAPTTLCQVRVLISNDNSTYTQIAGGSSINDIYYGSFRYVRIQSYNGDTGSQAAGNWKYYSLEVYSPNIRKEYQTLSEIVRMVTVVGKSNSWFYEVLSE
jgi:hypothetical protein